MKNLVLRNAITTTELPSNFNVISRQERIEEGHNSTWVVVRDHPRTQIHLATVPKWKNRCLQAIKKERNVKPTNQNPFRNIGFILVVTLS